jgi:hypothetical protein
MSRYKKTEYDEFNIGIDLLEANEKIIAAIDNAFRDVAGATIKKEAEFEKFLVKSDAADFILKILDSYAKQLELKLNIEVIPKILYSRVMDLIEVTKEFDIPTYSFYASNIGLYQNIIRVVIIPSAYDDSVGYELYVNREEILNDLREYEEGVEYARELYKKSSQPYSDYWALYYKAAREGLKIMRKKITKGGTRKNPNFIEVDKTQEYATKYWRTIEARSSKLYESMPFIAFFYYGSNNIPLRTNIGGEPYPVIPPTPRYVLEDVITYIGVILDNELDILIRDYIGNLPDIEIEIPEETEEEIDKAIQELVEKGVSISDELAEVSDEKLKEIVVKYMQSLGYKKVDVKIFKTRRNIYTMRVRGPDGRFYRWRQ